MALVVESSFTPEVAGEQSPQYFGETELYEFADKEMTLNLRNRLVGLLNTVSEAPGWHLSKSDNGVVLSKYAEAGQEQYPWQLQIANLTELNGDSERHMLVASIRHNFPTNAGHAKQTTVFKISHSDAQHHSSYTRTQGFSPFGDKRKLMAYEHLSTVNDVQYFNDALDAFSFEQRNGGCRIIRHCGWLKRLFGSAPAQPVAQPVILPNY